MHPTEHFDAIVIGTGFGATVAVTELRAKGKRVLMLERGLWFFTPERPLPGYIARASQGEDPEQPIQYWPRPNHRDGLIDLLAMARTNLKPSWLRCLGNWFHRLISKEIERQPLYRYNIFSQIDVLTASGVGGGSLVYSNVSIEPYNDGADHYPVMERWPQPLLPADYDSARAWMTKYRGPGRKVVTRFPLPQKFRDAMRAAPGDPPFDVDRLPQNFESLYLRKSFALKYAAENLAGEWKARMDPHGWGGLSLQVNEVEDVAGYDYTNRPICERQGRCLLGCLPAARHTLNKTLLTSLNLGADPGFQVRPLTQVDYIRALPQDAGYEIVYHDLRNQSEKRVAAPVVVLAAGCLGSTEILLRSAGKGLALSSKLGSLFSSNGDFAGFVVNIAPKVTRNSTAQPNPVWPAYATRGPINTSHVMFHDGKLHFTVEDSAVPGMFAAGLRVALEILEKGASHPHFKKVSGIWSGRALNDLLPLIPDPEKAPRFETEDEMLMDVFFFNTMATDRAGGQFSLHGDRLMLDFPGDPLANDPVFSKTEEILRAMAVAMGGEFRPSFLWDGFTKKRIITVHPLGGCPMGRSSTDGVVDKYGRVFKTASGSEEVYRGLFVMDGSIIPGALAVNPTLTIVAQCLRIAQML